MTSNDEFEKIIDIKNDFEETDFENVDNKITNQNSDTNLINIKMVQRNGKKCTTIIENLLSKANLDIKNHIKFWKKKYGCNVFIEKDENDIEIIKLSGNQISNIQDYLIKENICSPSEIRIH